MAESIRISAMHALGSLVPHSQVRYYYKCKSFIELTPGVVECLLVRFCVMVWVLFIVSFESFVYVIW